MMESVHRIEAKYNPVFIVLEGIDGSGTTTQAHRLADGLATMGRDCLLTREPSDLPVGRHIRDILRHKVEPEVSPDTLALLFAADRLDHVDREIRPALESGRIVVSDRYDLSSVAYQGVLTGDLEWVRSINSRALRPDLEILLDLPPEVAAQRRAGRDSQELFEVDELQARVADAYREAARVTGAVVLDGALDADTLANQILELVLERIGRLR